MRLFNTKKLQTIAVNFRDTVICSFLASIALGMAEFSFFGSVHVANAVFGAVAGLACIGLLALAAANVALIVWEVRE